MDWYIRHSLLKDGGLLLVIWLTATYFPFVTIAVPDKPNQLNIISNLISASVSLAGFIIAALTILVTYKLSVEAKAFEQSDSPISILFVSKHYRNMIKVYQIAIIELLAVCVFLYTTWSLSDSFSPMVINRTVGVSIVALLLPMFRSLMLLFRLLSLDNARSGNQMQAAQNAFR